MVASESDGEVVGTVGGLAPTVVTVVTGTVVDGVEVVVLVDDVVDGTVAGGGGGNVTGTEGVVTGTDGVVTGTVGVVVGVQHFTVDVVFQVGSVPPSDVVHHPFQFQVVVVSPLW